MTFSDWDRTKKLPERTYGISMSVPQMVSAPSRSTPEVDAIMHQLARSRRGDEQYGLIRASLGSLSSSRLELIAESLLVLREWQDSFEERYGKLRSKRDRKVAFSSVIHGMHDDPLEYPYDYIVTAIFSDSSEFDLKIIRDTYSSKADIPDLWKLCHAMRVNSIPVTKENVQNQLAAKAHFDLTRSVIFYDDTEKDYYEFPGLIKTVYDHMDRFDEVVRFARKRGSVESFSEFLSLESAIAEGAL